MKHVTILNLTLFFIILTSVFVNGENVTITSDTSIETDKTVWFPSTDWVVSSVSVGGDWVKVGKDNISFSPNTTGVNISIVYWVNYTNNNFTVVADTDTLIDFSISVNTSRVGIVEYDGANYTSNFTANNSVVVWKYHLSNATVTATVSGGGGVGSGTFYCKGWDKKQETVNKTQNVTVYVGEEEPVASTSMYRYIFIGDTKKGGSVVSRYYEALEDVEKKRYKREDTVSANIIIINKAEFQDKVGRLTTYLQSPGGETYNNQTEYVELIPPACADGYTYDWYEDLCIDGDGETAESKKLSISVRTVPPLNAEFGKWKLIAEFETCVQPPLKMYDSFQIYSTGYIFLLSFIVGISAIFTGRRKLKNRRRKYEDKREKT